MNNTGASSSPALLIISSLLTPALLMVGSGSLVSTALMRLGRAIDRARYFFQLSEEERKRLGWTDEDVRRWLERYARRSVVAERAVTALYIAIGIFVVDGFAISIDRALNDSMAWLPVSVTIGGMLLMCYSAACMITESKLAMQQIREELHRPTETSPPR